jgi:hypothetical protein
MSDENEQAAPVAAATAGQASATKAASWSRRFVALVVAVALVGAGVGAAVALSSTSGGASSPAGAVDELLQAAGHSDLIGVLDALAPGERQAIEPGLEDLAHQLERLGILASDTDLSSISGFGLHFSGIVTKTVSLGSSLAAVSVANGKVTETVDPAKLPIGVFVSGLVGSRLGSATTTHTSAVATGADPIVTEKVGGSWYVSLGYTLAIDTLRSRGVGRARSSAPLRSSGSTSGPPPVPSGSIPPAASASADDAVRAFLDDSAAFNLRALISVLAPGEVGALQTYAPDFLGSAESSLGRVRSEVEVEITSMNLSDSSVNGGTLVRVSDVGLKATVRGITITIKNGCESVTTVTGATTSHCPSPRARSAEEQRLLAILPASLRPLAIRLFSAHPVVGIASLDENGGWFVSPTATLLDDVDAYLAILQPQDLTAIADLVRDRAQLDAILHALEGLATTSVAGKSALF